MEGRDYPEHSPQNDSDQPEVPQPVQPRYHQLSIYVQKAEEAEGVVSYAEGQPAGFKGE